MKLGDLVHPAEPAHVGKRAVKLLVCEQNGYERLEAIGIETVDDLLRTEPDAVASELDHRRVSSKSIQVSISWSSASSWR